MKISKVSNSTRLKMKLAVTNLKYHQRERLVKLNNSAIRQMKILENDKSIKELEMLNKNLIETK